MTNRHRGEVTLRINGREQPMRLTLQSLAEIEAQLGSDLAEIGTRFSNGRARARDVIVLLGAALRGGGLELDDAAIGQKLAAEQLPEIIERLSDLFRLTFGEAPAPNPPVPQNA
jgi:hypothetical protein